jgi:hypothetical protein
MSSSFGGSVASASAPSVSMIMLTQSNCTAVRGALPELTSRCVRISDNELRKKLAKKFKICYISTIRMAKFRSFSVLIHLL